MNSDASAPTRIGFWAVLILGVFAWAPALYPGYWQGWEGFAPVFQSVTPAALATVATTPDLWRGAGSGAFLLAQPLFLLGATPVQTILFTFVLTFILGGAGIYVWLADRLGDRGAGLAGLAYTLLPLTLATVYVRGSVSDALILALTPLALAGLASYTDRRSLVGAAVAVLSILWMWRIQAGLALAVTVMLLIYALVVERGWLAALIVLASGGAGLVSLAPLWGGDSAGGDALCRSLHHREHAARCRSHARTERGGRTVSDWFHGLGGRRLCRLGRDAASPANPAQRAEAALVQPGRDVGGGVAIAGDERAAVADHAR
jgi:hypothetical protein